MKFLAVLGIAVLLTLTACSAEEIGEAVDCETMRNLENYTVSIHYPDEYGAAGGLRAAGLAVSGQTYYLELPNAINTPDGFVVWAQDAVWDRDSIYQHHHQEAWAFAFGAEPPGFPYDVRSVCAHLSYVKHTGRGVLPLFDFETDFYRVEPPFPMPQTHTWEMSVDDNGRVITLLFWQEPPLTPEWVLMTYWGFDEPHDFPDYTGFTDYTDWPHLNE